MKKTLIFTAFLLAVVFVPINSAKAFQIGQLIDPFCLFACEDEQPQTVNNVNSYNTNSNINSPNSTVISGGTVITGGSTTVRPSPTATVVVTNNNYDYNHNYNSNYNNYTSPLSASCYSTPTSANINSAISWYSSVSGGSGNYSVTWSGTDGLSGYGTAITRSYSSGGSKTASITVTSGGQTLYRNCNTVQIYDNYNSYNYNNNYNYDYYNYNNYNYNNGYYNNYPISVSCSANTTYVNQGTSVTWQAYATGGNGYFTYTWGGTDGIYGYSSYANAYYSTPGTKTAYVTVTSGNQTRTQYCSNSVSVGGTNYTYPPTYPNYPSYTNQTLQLACYPNKTSVKIGALVTWTAETSGTLGGYSGNNLTYSWIGTEGLSGSQSSIFNSYDYSGTKTATVTVLAPNGQAQSKTCTGSVYVQPNAVVKAPVKTVVVQQTPAPVATQIIVQQAPEKTIGNMTLSELFSVNNIPWGWISILVILILFFIIMYMMFNKTKI